jgi:aldehyde:ferredoxin oxidoreductase
MTTGYAGRVLHVDLTDGSVEKKPLDLELAKQFVGAEGIDLRVAYDLIKPNIDPLSPDNVIFLSAGPLVGTQLGTRLSSLCKYPLTGAIAFGSGGMAFGPRLKWAGYDQVVIKGRAPKPVYLRIYDDDVEICDASDLWGKDTVETTEALWARLGRLYSVIAIGKTGENLVPLSIALVDKCSSIGKGGMPAVMGSKNLKAVAVKGSKPVQFADPDKIKKIRDEVVAFQDATGGKRWISIGKMWFALLWGYKIAWRNYKELFPPAKFKELYSEDIYLNEIRGKRLGCAGCRYWCKDLFDIDLDSNRHLTSHISSSSGRVYNIGIQCAGGCTFKEAIQLIDVASRLGVDSHSVAPAMMLAVELYERGVITKEDTGGLELKHDYPTTLALFNKIANREDIGDVLAEGSLGIIRKFGKEYEKDSFHIKGLDQQMDARSYDFSMMVFCQVTNPEGGSMEPAHVGSNWFPHSIRGFKLDDVRAFCERMGMPKETIGKVFNFPPGCYSTPIPTKWAEDFYGMLTALGICEYRTEFFSWPKYAELYSAATGIKMTADDLLKAGERVWNLFRAINAREGFNRKDDRFPPRWLEPMQDSEGNPIPVTTTEGRPISMDTFNKMLDEYYEERGWDVKTGLPTKEKLTSLGLADIAADLQRRGFLK